MKFAIIAAGEGTRLKQEGVREDKPLVQLSGEPLFHRLVRIFRQHGAQEIVSIINPQMLDAVEYAFTLQEQLEKEGCLLRVVVQKTPSSMHSLHAISHFLQGEAFCLTTVDTIFRENDFSLYLEAFNQQKSLDGLLGVTSYIDDESPLYVETTPDLRITGFHDEPAPPCHYISAGIYGLQPSCLPILQQCIDEGQSRMRNFQRQLVKAGQKLHAFAFPKVIDIDHATDIAQAETLLLS